MYKYGKQTNKVHKKVTQKENKTEQIKIYKNRNETNQHN